MNRIQRNCLTATLLMGMMFLAAIFTLQGAAVDLHVGILFCVLFTFLCSLFLRFARLPDNVR